ncbi:hypothetical protein HBB16_21020 [Pseudonocardia sp. MCCB 268]|nr:hypothetical protein [Pseudonocardia cytotoxica]
MRLADRHQRRPGGVVARRHTGEARKPSARHHRSDRHARTRLIVPIMRSSPPEERSTRPAVLGAISSACSTTGRRCRPRGAWRPGPPVARACPPR